MRRLRRLGLRSRLALAFGAVAALAIGIATVVGDVGLQPRLETSAQARLDRQAHHFGEVAAIVYAETGSWRRAHPALRHLAALDELNAEVRVGGDVVLVTDPLNGVRAEAPVMLPGGERATVTISPASGELFSAEEHELHRSLDQLHAISAAVAIAAALAIGLLLAETLTRPLRGLRQTAERMEHGHVDARAAASNTPEIEALGRALNRLAATLEHEEEIRKANAADLAHELRTPVNALLSRIEAAQDGVLDGPENLAAMHAEAVRLTRLLNDLSRLADAERPGLLLDKEPVDLAEVAQRVAASFEPRFDGSPVRLVVETTPALVLGDEGRLDQILANLVANARRYTDAGEVRISVRDVGDSAVLAVSDTGIGIAPEDIRHVFTRFWRGDRSRSRATGGAGIGLAIVRELVRAHDGRVAVESHLGEGSLFTVTLPSAPVGRTRTTEAHRVSV